MSVAHTIIAIRALVAGTCGISASALWPWDWRGRRRMVTLKRDRRPYE